MRELAQSAARNALTAAKVIFTDEFTYEAVTPEVLAQMEPELSFVDGRTSSVGPRSVSVQVVSAGEIRIAVLSESGSCFGLRDVTSGSDGVLGVTFASVEGPACAVFDLGEAGFRADWTRPGRVL